MRVGPAICQATILQPGVQLSVGFKLWSRHKEPSPEYADLVLDLTLLPTRSRRTSNRIDQIVSAHLLEPAIAGPLLANKNRVHRRLRSTIVLGPMADKVLLS